MARFVSPPDLWDHATLVAINDGRLVLQPGQRFRCGSKDTASHILDRVRVNPGYDPDIRAFHGPRAAVQRREFLASMREADKRSECNRIARLLQMEAKERACAAMLDPDEDDSLIPAECATAWDVMCGALMGVDCNEY